MHFCLLLGLREVEHYNQKYMDVKFAFFYLPLLENDQTSSTDFFFLTTREIIIPIGQYVEKLKFEFRNIKL